MENERQGLEAREAVLAGTWATFGDNVRRLRKARGWTQGQLADRLREGGIDLHQTTIAKIEGGTRPTVVHEIWTLAAVFNVGLDVLFPPIAQEDPRDDERGRELMRRRDELHMRLAEANNEAERIANRVAALEMDLHMCLQELADLGGDDTDTVRWAASVASELAKGADHGVDQEAR